MVYVITPPKFAYTTCYKYYVAKGNNHNLIKLTLSRRWWWAPVEDIEKQGKFDTLNLLWTPWINERFLNSIKGHEYKRPDVNASKKQADKHGEASNSETRDILKELL